MEPKLNQRIGVPFIKFGSILALNFEYTIDPDQDEAAVDFRTRNSYVRLVPEHLVLERYF